MERKYKEPLLEMLKFEKGEGNKGRSLWEELRVFFSAA